MSKAVELGLVVVCLVLLALIYLEAQVGWDVLVRYVERP